MRKIAFLSLIVITLAACAPAPTPSPTPAPPIPTPAPATPTPLPPTPTPAPSTPIPKALTPTPLPPTATPTPAAKRVVLIIAHKGFRDEEYARPRAVFEAKGFQITVASSSLEMATGMLGARVKPDILVSDIAVGNYDAIVFVGGVGAKEYWDDPNAHRIAREAVGQGKVLAAICIAPATLARAGVLKGKRVTAFKGVIGEVRAGGATYTGADVERDGLIITAIGPQAAAKWGEEIVKALGE